MTMRFLNVSSKSSFWILMFISLIASCWSVNGQTGSDSSTNMINDFKRIPEIKWEFRTKGEIRSSVCIGGDTLFLNGGDGTVYALDKKTGKQIWSFLTKGERKYDFADYFHSTPVLNNGILYFGSGDGNLYAVNQGSGTLVWKFQTGNIVHTTPAIDNSKIFIGSFDGYVYALSLPTGELAWKFKTVGH